MRDYADLSVENELFKQGMTLVAGMDEVGRGSLAGPAMVGVALVTPETQLAVEGLIDSKALTARKRAEMVIEIESWCPVAVGCASPAEIDALGITVALRLAGQRALAQLATEGFYPDAVLLDGKHDWLTAPLPDLFSVQEDSTDLYSDLLEKAWSGVLAQSSWYGRVQMEIKGDYRCASIAAASVVAKVKRDGLMDQLAEVYPEYGWAKNKGYGSVQHRKALEENGATPEHRLSWALGASSESLDKAYKDRNNYEQ